MALVNGGLLAPVTPVISGPSNAGGDKRERSEIDPAFAQVQPAPSGELDGWSIARSTGLVVGARLELHALPLDRRTNGA